MVRLRAIKEIRRFTSGLENNDVEDLPGLSQLLFPGSTPPASSIFQGIPIIQPAFGSGGDTTGLASYPTGTGATGNQPVLNPIYQRTLYPFGPLFPVGSFFPQQSFPSPFGFNPFLSGNPGYLGYSGATFPPFLQQAGQINNLFVLPTPGFYA